MVDLNQTVEQATSDKLWTALATAFTLIISLVSVLYYRLNSDMKDMDASLESGKESFGKIDTKLAQHELQIASLQSEQTYVTKEEDRLESYIRKIDNRLLVVETERKNCCGQFRPPR